MTIYSAPRDRYQAGRNSPLPGKLLHPRVVLATLLTIGLAGIFWPATHAASDNFILYFAASHEIVPFASSGGAKYLPVIQVLNLLGKVEGIQEKKNSLRVFFNSNQIEMRSDDKKIEAGTSTYQLSAPVLLAGGKWMAPVDFLTTIIPPLTHQSVEYQEGASRIFIGDVRPSSFTVKLDNLANGARLTLQFTDKVAIHTAANNGKWVVFLGDHPVEPMESGYHFQNAFISNLEFDDEDGLPKLIVSPETEGLTLNTSLADGGKTLIVDLSKGGTAPPQPTGGQAPNPAIPGAPTATPEPTPTLALPVVVLDPGHGGSDNGAHSNDGVLEKDLMVQFALRAQIALLSTSKYRVVVTRTGDQNATDEQRAETANTANAIYFLSFHASDLGTNSPRIAIFTFAPPSPPEPAVSSDSTEAPGSIPAVKSSMFVPWSHVQEGRLPQSQQLAQALETQLSQIHGLEVFPAAGAPLHTLRSVNAPAAAIEIGRLAPDAPGLALTDTAFQQQVAAAIVRALASFEKGVTGP
jgi:N-acetylmuramoyl-L-alanine amidase